jgi:CheY-like chemotaxis protein
VTAPESEETSKKILLVDDDPIILGTLSLKLKSKGYQVVTASDGSQAITVSPCHDYYRHMFSEIRSQFSLTRAAVSTCGRGKKQILIGISSIRLGQVVLVGALCCFEGVAHANSVTNQPYQGVTKIVRTETSPRVLHINVMEIDLTAPGVGFAVTPHSGNRDTTAATTLNYMIAQQAQIGINAHFFQPNSTDATRWVIGLAASAGNIYQTFEGPTPAASNPVGSLTIDQSYAIMYYAPALNIDSSNNAQILHYNSSYADKKHVLESVTLYNAVAGSAQIVTAGAVTIPTYTGNPATGLTTNGTYNNGNSWYNAIRARTAVGLSSDNRTLVLFTVDEAGGSQGMTVGEVAAMLKNDYGVFKALNLDGGGSTTMTMQDPTTHVSSIINTSSANPNGQSVGSSLLVFAAPLTDQAPTVSITSPTNGATVTTNFTISATAADSDGTVTNVSFYDGSTLLGSTTTSPYSYVWNPAPAGGHALTAVAQDNGGLSTTSAVVNVTVVLTNSVTTHPYRGVTKIVRTETSPRVLHINVMEIDLTAPGVRFAVTPHSGDRDTTAATTLNYMIAQQAQIGINAHFYQPDNTDPTQWVIGLAASAGDIYQTFEGPTPTASNPVGSLTVDQSYAIMYYAPALNIDLSNNAQIVHYDSSYADKKHVLEPVTLYNAVAGSAQIVTTGAVTIPTYTGDPATGLTALNGWDNSNSWYNDTRARTAVGLSSDNHTLVLFTVDEAGGSQGMTVGEVAAMLKNDYGVFKALNLDGGSSTTMTMQDPTTHVSSIINTSSADPNGKTNASSLLVFIVPTATLTNFTRGPLAGQFTVNGSTDIAGNLVTEKTTSLAHANWQPYQTNLVPGGGFSFTIPRGTDPQAFFRLMGQ